MSWKDMLAAFTRDFGSTVPLPRDIIFPPQPAPEFTPSEAEGPEPVSTISTIEIKDMTNKLRKNPRVKWSDFNQPRQLSKIKFLVVHHTADNINDIHRLNEIEINGTRIYKYGCPTIPYHYWINEDAQIHKCNNLSDITWHAKNANPVSVGIALVGNYEKQKPSAAALKSLEFLLNELLGNLKLPVTKVFGHRELTMYGNSTACPGRFLFPFVQEFRRG
ncbi:MAG: peptidoglycan recognition family protein [Candidatus Margulisiibacteriota bacterium]